MICTLKPLALVIQKAAESNGLNDKDMVTRIANSVIEEVNENNNRATIMLPDNNQWSPQP